MRPTILAVALLAWLGTAGPAEAKWPWGASRTTPGTVPGTAGMRSWAGLPGMGGPIGPTHTKPGMSPVIGSAYRTSHFAHPGTGRARYTGTAYDPITGRFSKYRFRN